MANNNKKVGYKSPPVHAQFRRGHSGNPAGRPKGRKNFATVLRELLNEKIELTVGGRKRTMTSLAAQMRRLHHLAMSGDIKALQLSLSLAGTYDADAAEAPRDEAADLRLLQEVMRVAKGNGNEPDPNA